MSKRKAKRLYWAALHSYRKGYIDGAQSAAHARKTEGARIPRLTRLWNEDEPAYAAGYDAGLADDHIDQGRLPLGVWVRVLAADSAPDQW